ncbi:hypothetical protein ACLKA6_008026 [Drosophila palustris]
MKRSRVQKPPPQQFHTPKAIWNKNATHAVGKASEIRTVASASAMAPANLEETALPSSAPAVLQTVRKPRSRPDAIIIEPKEKMTYSEILNLVNRSQDDKLKSVGESVHRIKCTAKGALLLELNETNPKSTQQLRDNIGSVLERKIPARALS